MRSLIFLAGLASAELFKLDFIKDTIKRLDKRQFDVLELPLANDIFHQVGLAHSLITYSFR